MTLKNAIETIKARYVQIQVRRVSILTLTEGPVKRYHFVFSGRVQGVGFRLHFGGMAQRLGLTGWVQNRPDGSVEAELQGSDQKIDCLEAFMASLIRIRIDRKTKASLDIDPTERTFRIL